MPVIIDPSSGLLDVLWMFSRFMGENQRITLKQNPHFYKRLPTTPEAYGGEFRMKPTLTFQHERISVLIDSSGHAGRVFLEAAGSTRAFGNVWVVNDVIVFKGSYRSSHFSLSDTLIDVRGKLDGESIIGEAIRGIPNLWCFKERPLSLASQPALSPIQNSSSLTVTASQITSAAGILIRDWREPIRQMLQSRDVNIRITDKPPDSTSSGY